MKTYEIKTKYNEIIKALAGALEITETDVKDAVLRSYVHDNDETNTRLCRVFCKAARGEKITIAVIGGSTTQEAHGEKCWFEHVCDWFRIKFPKATVNSINAGIGNTPSFLGAFCLDQMVLSHQPDLVMVDFSANDVVAIPYLLKDEIFESYEAIIRRCLEFGIAVMPVFLLSENGSSLQNVHSEIADHYNLPAISHKNAVCSDGELICDWAKLNRVGHTLLGTCISNYLDNALESTNLLADYALDELHTSWIYFDSFKNTYAQYAYEFQNRAKGFEFIENIPEISDKWRGSLVSENNEGSVKLIVPKGAKRVYVQYFNSSGSFETKFISQLSLCNTQAIGCKRAMWHRVYTGNAITDDSEITIKSHKDGKVIILGLLVAF